MIWKGDFKSSIRFILASNRLVVLRFNVAQSMNDSRAYSTYQSLDAVAGEFGDCAQVGSFKMQLAKN